MTQLHNQGHADVGVDFAVHDTEGRLTAAVQVKRRFGTDGHWAAQFRQNVLSRGGFPFTSLFVLIVPDRLYIWQASVSADAWPTYEVDARSLFASYFQRIGVQPEKIGPMAFEQLVAWWLADMARGDSEHSHPELSRSGLMDALEGGHISHEAAV